MSAQTLDLQLIPVSKKFAKNGGYRGFINGRRVIDFDGVLDEVIKNNHLSLSKVYLKTLLSTTFDTMIQGVLTDGQTRRLGDYMMLQLELTGGFDEPGDQFDPNKHKLEVVLRPLKEFRRKPGRDDVKVYNRNAGPTVVINRTYSEGQEGNVVEFGKDIILSGENLFAVDDKEDSISVKYFTQRAHGTFACQIVVTPDMVSTDGKTLRIPWDDTIGEFIRNNPEKYDPSVNRPVAVMIGLRSRGGAATAKQQLHRGRAYFSSWLEIFPDYREDFNRIFWGPI